MTAYTLLQIAERDTAVGMFLLIERIVSLSKCQGLVHASPRIHPRALAGMSIEKEAGETPARSRHCKEIGRHQINLQVRPFFSFQFHSGREIPWSA